jgi:hypothetical protein
MLRESDPRPQYVSLLEDGVPFLSQHFKRRRARPGKDSSIISGILLNSRPRQKKSDIIFSPQSQFSPGWVMMLDIWHAVNPNAKWLLG